MMQSSCALTGTPQTLICTQSGTLRRAFFCWSERKFDKLSSNKKNSAKWSQIGRNRQIYAVPFRAHGLYLCYCCAFESLLLRMKNQKKKNVIFYQYILLVFENFALKDKISNQELDYLIKTTTIKHYFFKSGEINSVARSRTGTNTDSKKVYQLRIIPILFV